MNYYLFIYTSENPHLRIKGIRDTHIILSEWTKWFSKAIFCSADWRNLLIDEGFSNYLSNFTKVSKR